MTSSIRCSVFLLAVSEAGRYALLTQHLPEEFLASVGESPDLSREHQALLREFLRQSDLVKFAGIKPASEDIERSVGAARQFLDETRENAPLIDESPQDEPVPETVKE